MANEKHPSQRKPRLGRGLSSLIASSSELAAETQDSTYIPTPSSNLHDQIHRSHELMLAVDQIGPNPYQPRQEFSEVDLRELAKSIAKQGILQPLIVCPADSHDQSDKPYLLVAGERRLRASKLAGLASVPCIIRHATQQQMLEWALVENIQRSDLNPIERAEAYRQYMDRFGLSQTEAAERLGQPRTTLSNYLRLLDLCDEVRQLLVEGVLTFGHAKVLAGLVGQPDQQLTLARKTIGDGLSVRSLEKQLEALRAAGNVSQSQRTKNAGRSKPAFVIDLEENLTRSVGTRVKILPGRAKHSGRIVIDYYNLDDFDRIAGTLGWKGEVESSLA